MEKYEGFNISVKNFKCFGSEPQGFNEIRRLNLIIGRNNTGKSALLDLVHYGISPYDHSAFSYQHKSSPNISITSVLSQNLLGSCFPRGTRGGGFPGDHQDYGLSLAGSKMTIEILPSNQRDGKFILDREYLNHADTYLSKVAKQLPNPLNGLKYVHIAAERDIVAEKDFSPLDLTPDGVGATNIIQHVLNDEGLPSDLIEDNLRNDLNIIMGPDANFTRIATQRRNDDSWMIYLDERSKGRVSLSDSGSGLKTIILVLLNMLVTPFLDNLDPSTYVFAFEELENNLHPGLQRRLLNYIQDRLVEFDAIAFITTHAPAVIDMFSRAEDAQIIHVTHDGQTAKVHRVANTTDGHNVLNDLDVKASDLLQANGIIWVEGISDIIYIRRWITLYCMNNNIPIPVEGSEYAFMEYGGRCLNHFDFKATCPEDLAEADAEWLIPALSISRNTYVVMDSDKKGGKSNINATKIKASESAGGSWITVGKEIENYLPPEIASDVFGENLKQYDSAAKVYKLIKGIKLDKKKAALEAVELLSIDNWRYRDLEEQIRILVENILNWNPTY